MRPFVFTLLLLPALPFTGKAQTAPLPEAYKKFVNFFSSERMKVREGGCNDCSNIVLLKLQFGKRDIPDSVFLSYSAPLSIQSWTTKIRELDIDWKQLLKDNGKAKTVILPVLYINEISGGSAMFASARDLSQGLFQFANGGLPAGDTTKWWEPIIITTTTANTESSMLLNNKNLQQK
ncbi:hypothetical protein SAMN04488122_0936 [Chitinophaga arvensicola]|uniref:Uncharacterized protein n=1 Tax=Chitinophaga arvensicola TaxID=29529 RepID=A0A1I0PRP3_9BACT|nr:hypothetical protein SAMN04488122_0936 [Chitinophaga arvensicola]